MSEGGGAAPRPWILDVSVLVAVARADAEVTQLLMILDDRGQPLVIPVLAMGTASLEARTEDADVALRGLERLENVMTAPLRDAEQAARLAAIIGKAGIEPGDAHVAAVATASGCPILTLDAAKWREHASGLDEPLETIEIQDPPGSQGGSDTRLPIPAGSGAPGRTRPRLAERRHLLDLSLALPLFDPRLHRAEVRIRAADPLPRRTLANVVSESTLCTHSISIGNIGSGMTRTKW